MIVSPSLLSADFAHLGDAVVLTNESEADWIHCDVMDGVFVPNISFGFPVIKAISKVATKPLDVHLMIVDPGRYVEETAKAGAAIMTVHWEACTHLHRTIQAIHNAGMKAGVSLNPATPVELLRDILPEIDLVLLMSVNPGFGGQKFIEGTISKIRRLKSLILETGSSALIEIDGGINTETGRRCFEAGADAVVAGNAVYGAEDPKEAIKALKNL